MLRICKTYVGRSFLQPRVLVGTPPVAGVQKKSIEEKLGFLPKPKRPAPPYFKFLTRIRPVLTQKYPDAKVTEIAKLGGEEWAKADQRLKHQLEHEYKLELNEYMKQMGEYEKSLTDEQKEQIDKAKEDANYAKEKRDLRKKMKELGKPKRPVSPYMTYMFDDTTRKDNEPYQDYQVRVAKLWEQEDEKLKAKYIANFTKQMESYKHDLQKWEEKMIRLGNIDMVRNEALIETPEPRKRVTSTKKSK